MKRLLMFLMIVLLACSSEKPKKEERPESILSQEKMVAILTDVQLIEGAITKKLIDEKEGKKHVKEVYAATFEKHNITKEVFDESMEYYQKDTEKLEKIYDEVLNELSKKKAELKNKQD